MLDFQNLIIVIDLYPQRPALSFRCPGIQQFPKISLLGRGLSVKIILPSLSISIYRGIPPAL